MKLRTLNCFQLFLAGAAMLAACDLQADELYDFSATYGAYTISGSFDATTTGSLLSDPTNITLLVNGVNPGGTGFLDGWDNPSPVISLVPGQSDFAFIENNDVEGSTIEVGFHLPGGTGVAGLLYLGGPIGSAEWVSETSGITIEPASATVPEGGETIALLGGALLGLAALRRKFARA